MRRTAVSFAGSWQTHGELLVREVRYHAGAEQTRHAHDESSVSLVLAGELEETCDNDRYLARAGSVVFKPAGWPHANLYGPRGARVVQLMPRLGDGFYPRPLRNYAWHDAPRLARRIIAVLRGGPRADEAAGLALWDMLDQVAGDDGHATLRPRWWLDAVDLLDACQSGPISVSAIARRVGVHPVHLARVCRRQLGCTAREYILERRVLSAWRAWQRGEQSLAAAAQQAGFADQAHMTRAFSQVLGISPGRLRRLAAEGG
jgi:AraC family transcriptional regulator